MQNYESNSWWDKVWFKDQYSNDSLRKMKAKEKVDILLSYVAPQRNWNIVELGCGGGYVIEEVFKRTGSQITGVDFSEIAISKAKDRLGKLPIKLYKADVCKTNIEDNSVDLVICCGILEHIKDVDKFIDEVKRILKPKGFVYISSSNMQSFIWPQRLMKQSLGLWKYGYQKNWSYSKIIKFLQNKNIDILDSRILLSSGDYTYVAVIDKLISKVIKTWGRYIIILGEKNDDDNCK